MLLNLTALDLVTYRGALALRFVDNVTGALVADGLRARAWAFDPLAPGAARRVDEAERSPGSSIYGFRTLRGLERYQIGDDVPAASLAYVVLVEDLYGRYLPQTRRYDLPLALPAVQQVILYSAAERQAPSGYATVRGQLLATSAPPVVTAAGPAPWAQVALTVPVGSLGDPPGVFFGQADARGMVVVMVPFPQLAAGMLVYDASWTVTAAVNHEPAAQAADYALLEQVLPSLLADPQGSDRFPPFQPTLDAQGGAILFGTVTVVNVEARTYAIAGAANETMLDFDLLFGQPLTLRTVVEGVDGNADRPLSELLIQSA